MLTIAIRLDYVQAESIGLVVQFAIQSLCWSEFLPRMVTFVAMAFGEAVFCMREPRALEES